MKLRQFEALMVVFISVLPRGFSLFVRTVSVSTYIPEMVLSKLSDLNREVSLTAAESVLKQKYQ